MHMIDMFQCWILKAVTWCNTQLVLSTRGATIELRTSTTLLFSVRLALSRGEKTCKEKRYQYTAQNNVIRISMSHVGADGRPAKGS
jgi:hypothetical protein